MEYERITISFSALSSDLQLLLVFTCLAAVLSLVLSALALCLRRMSFLRLSPRDGARFAAGFARCGCGLRSLDLCKFRVRLERLTRAARIKSGK